MNRTKIALLAASLPLALAACSKQQEGVVAQAPPTAPPPPISASQVTTAIESLPEPDRSFVIQATSANMAAIRLGQLAAERGATVEVRGLGREMVDTHTALSDQLRQSASSQGITLPIPQLTADQEKMYADLSRRSGADFDNAFVRYVMRLQKETIAAFQNEAVHGRISELAMVANQTLPLLNQRVRTVQNQIHRM